MRGPHGCSDAPSSAGLSQALRATTDSKTSPPAPFTLLPQETGAQRRVSHWSLLQPQMLSFPKSRAEEPGLGGGSGQGPFRGLFHALTSVQL